LKKKETKTEKRKERKTPSSNPVNRAAVKGVLSLDGCAVNRVFSAGFSFGYFVSLEYFYGTFSKDNFMLFTRHFYKLLTGIFHMSL